MNAKPKTDEETMIAGAFQRMPYRIFGMREKTKSGLRSF